MQTNASSQSPVPSPQEALANHLSTETKRRGGTAFDMEDGPDLTVLEPFPHLLRALESIGKIVAPRFHQADEEALRHQTKHRQQAKVAALTGVIAVVAACLQLGFAGDIPEQARWVVYGEIAAVVFCVVTIFIGLRTARQKKWLVCRNVAERCRHLKFLALTRSELWCGSFDDWEQWLLAEADSLERVTDADDLKDWVSDDPLLDPPSTLGTCQIDPAEAAALTIYFRHKRVIWQRDFFKGRSDRHHHHHNKLHLVPPGCFWISIAAAMLHFILHLGAEWSRLRLSIPWLADEHHREMLETLSRWLIVIAAAAPAIGAGVRTWLLAFEFGRSSLLYRALRGSLDKRLKALESASPQGVLAAIWFTEQALEEEHRAWIRLMLDAEWFG